MNASTTMEATLTPQQLAARRVAKFVRPPPRRHDWRKPPKIEWPKNAPPPPPRPAPRFQWSIGIVVAARVDDAFYLDGCIQSCLDAGFEPGQIVVFAEPGTPNLEQVESMGVVVTRRGRRLGCVPNWIGGLSELVHGQATNSADAILMLEDDTRLCPGLRWWLEQNALWPEDPAKLGAISLYTTGLYGATTPGWYKFDDLGFWGAQALLFSRAGALDFLSSPTMKTHRQNRHPSANNFVDGETSRWVAHSGRAIWFVVGSKGSSLVEHVGASSAVFPTLGIDGWRKEWWSVRAAIAGESPPAARCHWSPNQWHPRLGPDMAIAAAQPDAEGVSARAARRRKICETCRFWQDAVVDGATKKKCRACSNCVPLTIETIGNAERRCPANVPGWA